MKNLEAKLQAELAKSINEAMENYDKYLTVKEVAKITTGLKTLESYRTKIEGKVNKEYTAKDIAKLSEVSKETRTVQTMTVTVTYAKSATWGLCPTAKLSVVYTDRSYTYFTGERAGGCGYDKESASTASVFNQCYSLLKVMYVIKNDNVEQSNHDCIGYGAGYGVLPAFEGGVGFSCHRNIMEKLGYTCNHTANGKNFDVYTFELKGAE